MALAAFIERRVARENRRYNQTFSFCGRRDRSRELSRRRAQTGAPVQGPLESASTLEITSNNSSSMLLCRNR